MKCRLLVLLIALMGLGTNAKATVFISEVMVSTNSSKSKAKSQLTDAGYTVVDQDLNQGGGGHYVYVGYKTSTNLADAITGLIIVNGSSYAGTENRTVYVDGGIGFQAAPYTSDSKGGNLNRGRGGNSFDYYLYYTKHGNTWNDVSDLWKPITGLAGVSSTTPCEKDDHPTYLREYRASYPYSLWLIANLNEGGPASYYTYLDVTSTHECSMGYALTEPEKHKFYCSVCGHVRYADDCTFPYSNTYVAEGPERCYRACTVCRLNTYYSHNWTNVYSPYDDTHHYTPCSRCKYKKTEEHIYTTDWAQCSSVRHCRNCSICNYEDEEPHNWVYVSDPNDPDFHTDSCTVSTCGYTCKTIHIWQNDGGYVSATCTTAGSSGSHHCQYCNFIVGPTVIPPRGHQFDEYGVCTRTAGQKHYSHAKGDVTCNGEISLGDVTKLVQAIKTNHWANADYNNDGVLDLADIEALVDVLLHQQ